jgi:shikimate dehydrogenase
LCKKPVSLYGLIGYPLGHSFSQQYFSEKFAREGITNARYELFPLENIVGLPMLLERQPDLCGLNVTIPHKESVVPLLHELDDTARIVGAVNCIKIRDRRLTGFNTDVVGFEQTLKMWGDGQWAADGSMALILGTGGASKAVAYVLKKLGISFKFVSRNPSGNDQISYEALNRLPAASYHLIVNTTPLGMAPRLETCPDLPFERLTPQHLVYDLIYNPAETLLLQRAKAQGCSVTNGLEMLHLQAEAAWEIWNRK